MDLKEARATLADVAEDLDIQVGGTTRGKFGGDVLVLDLTCTSTEFTAHWVTSDVAKSPDEAARLIRGYAQRNGLTVKAAMPRWFDSHLFSASLTADAAILEPAGAQAEALAAWRTPVAQTELVEAAADAGVAVELGGYSEGEYVLVPAVPVRVQASRDAVLAEYRRQILDVLSEGAA
jgi:hypothetical protein